jgi:predicted transcriptional regulator
MATKQNKSEVLRVRCTKRLKRRLDSVAQAKLSTPSMLVRAALESFVSIEEKRQQEMVAQPQTAEVGA